MLERTYNLVTALKGCPLCSGRVRKAPGDDAALASERGWAELGPVVQTSRVASQWRCVHGHVFLARYSTVQPGFGCRHCAGRAAQTAGDFAELALARGPTWLDKHPGPTRAKTNWRCKHGHRITASYSSVRATRTTDPKARHGPAETAREARRRAHAAKRRSGLTPA